MKFPLTPCPPDLKPIFAEVLAVTRAKLAAGDVKIPLYLCHCLVSMADAAYLQGLPGAPYIKAKQFIRTALAGSYAYGTWLKKQDAEFQTLTSSITATRDETDAYENAGRIEWLEYLSA